MSCHGCGGQFSGTRCQELPATPMLLVLAAGEPAGGQLLSPRRMPSFRRHGTVSGTDKKSHWLQKQLTKGTGCRSTLFGPSRPTGQLAALPAISGCRPLGWSSPGTGEKKKKLARTHVQLLARQRARFGNRCCRWGLAAPAQTSKLVALELCCLEASGLEASPPSP